MKRMRKSILTFTQLHPGRPKRKAPTEASNAPYREFLYIRAQQGAADFIAAAAANVTLRKRLSEEDVVLGYWLSRLREARFGEPGEVEAHATFGRAVRRVVDRGAAEQPTI